MTALSALGEAALAYAARGWRVFPLTPYDPRYTGDPKFAPGKRPMSLCDFPCLARLKAADAHGDRECPKCGVIHAKDSRGVSTATTDAAIIRAWWTKFPNANIGLATGDGLWVLDVDGPDAARALEELEQANQALPLTVSQDTGKGRHYLFSVTGETRNTASRIAPGIDTRGDGGYIVAPPSTHPSGRAYRWRDGCAPKDLERAAPPVWLLALTQKPVRLVEAPSGPIASAASIDVGLDKKILTLVDKQCDEVARTPPGARNNALNTAAYTLGGLVAGQQLQEHVAIRALEAAVAAWGDGLPDGDARKIRDGIDAGKAAPFKLEWEARHARLEGRAPPTTGPERRAVQDPKWIAKGNPGPLFVGGSEEAVRLVLANERETKGSGWGNGFAVGSLFNFQGGIGTDPYGRIDVANPRADKARPAVTQPWTGEVVLLVAGNLAPMPARVRKPDVGGTIEIEVTSAERMEIMGLLAAFWWRDAGASSVKIARPPPDDEGRGRSWLEFLKSHQAA